MHATKKQGRSYKVSAIMARGLAYHFNESTYIEDLRNRQRLLLIQAANILLREQEPSGAMVTSYLMGWGDRYMSHHYVNIYWASFLRELERDHPELMKGLESDRR
ncbi:hypothetical protein BC834DRAFT_472263 [Gloeopeniophorella convolvens]|nr:hypothetical protein BC834DRAFT_472263 [Gloeopeniophorella convolvens]